MRILGLVLGLCLITTFAFATTRQEIQVALDLIRFTNVTAGTEDLHLVVGSALIDVGTDLSATFTDDIDGVTRLGTWDIGADEYVAVGGASPMQPRIMKWR